MSRNVLRRGYPAHLKNKFASAGALSLLAWGALQVLSPLSGVPWDEAMRGASERMRGATDLVAALADGTESGLDPFLDPNRTGLIGPEISPLFTTLGHLEAKRTSTNPDVAGLVVHLLRRAGVRAGDTVAVGASGSFPAFLLATLAAVETLGAHPVTILSVGSSSYGATRPDLHLLDIHELLRSQGSINAEPAAVSLGGGDDVGGGFEPAFRASLLADIEDFGYPMILESALSRNVAERIRIYLGSDTLQGRGRVSAFVNVGGSHANLGVSPLVLEVPPGLIPDPRSLELPPPEDRGVLFEMAARGVPLIHLLNVRGLALEYGLPWDPTPLPSPGSTELSQPSDEHRGTFWVLTALYLAGLALILGWRHQRSGRPTGAGS